MDRFEGNSGLAALLGLTGVLLLALVGFVIVQVAPEFRGFTWFTAACAVFEVGGFSAAGVFLLYAARESAASFVLDDEGITRCAWGRTTSVAWRDLVCVEEFNSTGAKFTGKAGLSGRYVLHGAVGKRLAIPFPFMTDGPRLRGRIEPHFALLRAGELRDLASFGRRFHPTRTIGFVVLTCIAPMFLLGGLVPFESGSTGADRQPASWRYFGALFVAASPMLAVWALELISRDLEVMTDGLALRSLFLDRKIPFDRVESITIKIDNAEGPVTEKAKVRSDAGVAITLDSGMPGYRAVLDLLRSRAPVKCFSAAGVDDDLA